LKSTDGHRSRQPAALPQSGQGRCRGVRAMARTETKSRAGSSRSPRVRRERRERPPGRKMWFERVWPKGTHQRGSYDMDLEPGWAAKHGPGEASLKEGKRYDRGFQPGGSDSDRTLDPVPPSSRAFGWGLPICSVWRRQSCRLGGRRVCGLGPTGVAARCFSV